MECLLDGALLSVPSLRFSTSSVLFPRRTRKPSLIYCSRSNSNEHRERIRRAICCNSVRRHQRRRDRGFGTRTKELFRNAGNSGEAAKDLLANDDTVVFTLDPQNVKQRVENFTESAHRAVRTSTARVVTLSKGLVNDGRMLLNDLCSSVSVDRDKRVVITLRRSSIDFAVSALLWSSLFILAWKIICKVSEKYSWGWEENLRPRSVVKRDRSLGGREVLVGRNIVNIHNRRQWTGSLDDRGRKFNPLDAVKTSLSEKDFIDQNRGKPLRKADRELSEWWPSSPLSHVSSGSMGIKDAEQKASLVLRMIIEKRSAGKDFEADDILELYRIGKYSGSKVMFDSAYVRDSFYRAAINMTLSSCGRSGSPGSEMAGEKGAEFLAGLAHIIHLDAERAVVMVNAAVAARTRSTFLQAWAFHVQGKATEAKEALLQLSNILTVFPPGRDSPEMEMVAEGLAKHLSFDERSRLLESFLEAAGSLQEGVAVEALGLTQKQL